MDVKVNAKRKLKSVLALVSEIQSGDFPHSDSEEVLASLNDVLQKQYEALQNLKDDADPDSVNALCKAVAFKVYVIYPLLGFILRSTNVRNSFELHGPFLRMVQLALGSSTKLIISSEWDFSPFTYQNPPDLGIGNAVLIGVPASETTNGLSIPITGHEFGHNIWRLRLHERTFRQSLSNDIVNYISNDIWDDFKQVFSDISDKNSLTDILGSACWRPSLEWASRQCEELFCDFIGLLIYREAYLNAFAYLLVPGLPGARSYYYPEMKFRAEALVSIAERNNITVPDEYSNIFDLEAIPGDTAEKFLLGISDEVVKRNIVKLGDLASREIVNSNLDDYDESEIDAALDALRIGVPIIKKSSLPSIINAGWRFKQGGMIEWKDKYPSIYKDEICSDNMLSDLIFKSIEVLEILELQGSGR